MVCDLLSMFDGTFVRQIGCDSCCTKSMAANLCLNAGSDGAAIDHAEHVVPVNSAQGQLAVATESSKHWPFGFFTNASGVKVVFNVFDCLVMSRHVVSLSAFFVESKPAFSSLDEVVFDVHSNRG